MPLSPVTTRSELFRARVSTATREIAVCLTAVLLVGMGALQSSAAAGPEAPAGAGTALSGPVEVAPSPLPAGQVPGRADRLPALDPAASRPGPAPVPEPAVKPEATAPAAPVGRWLPTGTGMWLHDWKRSEGGHARTVVTKARHRGLSHLFVQTGSSKKGWIGEEVLSQLLPATKGTDLKVIAWDFPKLDNPEDDARRLARAATWNRPGVPRVAAVAPDVETGAEGTRLSADGIRRYYSTLRAALPRHIAILATVPWPSEKRTGSYPYAQTAAYADAWIPMAYWYNRSPKTVTATSMAYLKRFRRPVMPVGQGYDGRIDAPYLPADPAPDKSVQAFVDAARAGGARSISLWSWQTTGPLQWGVLTRAKPAFTPAPKKVPTLLDELLRRTTAGKKQDAPGPGQGPRSAAG